jgi:hypothetical protein
MPTPAGENTVRDSSLALGMTSSSLGSLVAHANLGNRQGRSKVAGRGRRSLQSGQLPGELSRGQTTGMRVFHFLRADHAMDDIRGHRIKISLLEDLNDPFELFAAALTCREHRQGFRAFKRDMNQRFGVLCFSRNWHNPLLWSHYADKHKGICLGLHVPSRLLTPVTYTTSRLVDAVPRIAKSGFSDEAAMKALLSIKFRDWKYEDEVRVFCRLEDRDPLTNMYFAEFSPQLMLKHVILGARHDAATEELIQLVRGRSGAIGLTKARLAFRSFRVVRDRAARFLV